jgi:hypothetical protein
MGIFTMAGGCDRAGDGTLQACGTWGAFFDKPAGLGERSAIDLLLSTIRESMPGVPQTHQAIRSQTQICQIIDSCYFRKEQQRSLCTLVHVKCRLSTWLISIMPVNDWQTTDLLKVE